jgi:DNA polymerase V
MRDYNTVPEIKAVLLEMCEDVARRARESNKAGRTIALGVAYSSKNTGGGFQCSRTINEATNDTMKIYKVCKELLNENHDGRPVRHISVVITKLEDKHSMQLSLFDTRKWQVRKLGATMDALRDKYGSTAVLRAV